MDIKLERTWAMFSHLAAFAGHFFPFGNIIAPLIIWALKKDQSPFVNDQSRESINAQISFTVYLAIAGALCFVLIGYVILPIVWLADVILVIVAAMKANEGNFYRYPGIFRLVN